VLPLIFFAGGFMQLKWRIRGAVLAGALAASLLAAGCTTKKGTSEGSEGQAESIHLRDAVTVMTHYVRANQKSPPSLDALEKWAKKNDKSVKSDTFTSTRDHQPYVLVDTPIGPCLHEQTGADGKVYTSTPGKGSVDEMTNDRVNNMMNSIQQAQQHYRK
jgi:hypothetical protein